MSSLESSPEQQIKIGLGYGLISYTAFGCFPLYWKLLKGVPHIEVLCHRIIWSALFFFLLLLYKERRQTRALLMNSRKYLAPLFLSATFITFNWFTYIYAVNTDQVLETSLGYFIVPLVNILLGTLVLKEKLRYLQKIALVFACIGVLFFALYVGKIPYLAFILSFTFGTYGLIRKQVRLPPVHASTIETMIQCIPAMIFLSGAHSWFEGDVVTTKTITQTFFLVLGGIVTGLPLLWFAHAVKRLPLSTMGFLQYLSPSLQFLIAVYLFNEPFTVEHAKSFAFIWTGLLIYSVDLWRWTRNNRKKRIK